MTLKVGLATTKVGVTTSKAGLATTKDEITNQKLELLMPPTRLFETKQGFTLRTVQHKTLFMCIL